VIAGLTWEQFRDVLPLLTFALGIGAGWFGEVLNDKRTASRERTRWIVEQQARTLTDLSDVLRDHCERMQVVVEQRKREFAATGRWPDRVEASDSEWAARSRAFVLTQRIREDALRWKVDALTSVTTQAATLPDAHSLVARDAHVDAVMGWQDVNIELGAAVRDLYPDR
jgi:hypothetical protein